MTLWKGQTIGYAIAEAVCNNFFINRSSLNDYTVSVYLWQ